MTAMTPVPELLKSVKMLALDVDGVLTDGTIVYSNSGNEIKTFHARDGLGIRMLFQAGVPVCLITGRKSEALIRRCRDLKIEHIFDGVSDKTSVLDRFLSELGIGYEQVAYAGDDLQDIALLNRVGIPIAVADAHELVRERAVMTTRNKGGRGAVREICEAILKARGNWDAILKRFSL